MILISFIDMNDENEMILESFNQWNNNGMNSIFLSQSSSFSFNCSISIIIIEIILFLNKYSISFITIS